MFLLVSVILLTGGWVLSQHALQQVSGVCVCVCYPSMYCRWYPSMPCSRSLGGGGVCSCGVSAPVGVSAPGGYLLWGGVWSRGCGLLVQSGLLVWCLLVESGLFDLRWPSGMVFWATTEGYNTRRP